MLNYHYFLPIYMFVIIIFNCFVCYIIYLYIYCFLYTQVIEIIEEEEEGWWRGKMGSKQGVFPSNFVEEIFEEERKPGSQRASSPEPPTSQMPVMDSQTGERREFKCRSVCTEVCTREVALTGSRCSILVRSVASMLSW